MSARSWLRDIQNNDVMAITVWIVLIWPTWQAPKQMEETAIVGIGECVDRGGGGRRLRWRHGAAKWQPWRGRGRERTDSNLERIVSGEKKPGNVISQAKNAAPAKVDNPKLGELQNETILIFLIEQNIV